MPNLIYLLTKSGYPIYPQDIIGWLGWLALLGVILVLLRVTWRYHPHWNKRQGWILFILILCVPLASLLLPGNFSPGQVLLPTTINNATLIPVLMVFACLPWVIAAGLLGPAPAAGLGLFSGLFLVYFNSQSIFLPMEMSLLAVLFTLAVRQRYRTFFYRLLRHPLFAALLIGLLYPILFMIDSLLVSNGNLASRLNYAITNVSGTLITGFSSLLIAGLIAELIKTILPSRWGGQAPLKPSPAESRLTSRFLSGLAPLALILVVILIAGNWILSAQIAREMLKERMSNAAKIAAQTIPFFLSSGQGLLTQLSTDPALYSAEPEQIRYFLAQAMHTMPFFNQLILVDLKGDSIAVYPQDNNDLFLYPDERSGIILAINGVLSQNYPIPPIPGSFSARVSFLAAVLENGVDVRRVLIGRSDLIENPVAQVLLTSLNVLNNINGKGVLLDEEKHILFSPYPSEVMTVYTGHTAELSAFYDDTLPEGTHQLVYYQPIASRLWAVVFTIPTRNAQQLTLSIALPIIGLILILSAVALLVVLVGLRVVTASIQKLSVEAGQMAQGQLDQTLSVGGYDEIGQLRRAFEQLRVNLKARLDELNRLLFISRGVASTLEFETAMRPVLEAACLFGASSVRVVLAPEMVPELGEDSHTPTRFGKGSSSDLYQGYDDQILTIARSQDRLFLTNLMRPRLLVIPSGALPPGYSRPASLAVLALRHENLYYGVFWLAYDEPHQFSEEEVRFLVTLAGQAAMAASNARYFLTAEIGRQRLEAILASYPDPVIVTDHQNCLLLGNPAAWQVFGMRVETSKGQPIEKVIDQQEVVNLLRSSSNEQQSAEFKISEGRVYLAIASTVLIEGRRVGRVCVLRDVTHFKELDAVKNEFISTVSHDLRAPLSLIRGYTTMLLMVGVLNEQQNGYVTKIVSGVDKMTALVNNMLNLGRIEAGVELQLEKVAIGDVIERVVTGLQIQADQKHIQLDQVLPQSLIPFIEADNELIQQALLNLVENAIKYSESNTQVQIILQVQPDQVIVEVRDNGIGIASADQQHLFEKFYRVVKRGTRREDGTGLGLAIVKSIAERHHGRVWLDSQLGKGSSFYLAIPIRQPKV